MPRVKMPWFQNVEVVAAKEIGRETVQYVSNIFKYYVAYKLALEKTVRPQPAQAYDSPGSGVDGPRAAHGPVEMGRTWKEAFRVDDSLMIHVPLGAVPLTRLRAEDGAAPA